MHDDCFQNQEKGKQKTNRDAGDVMSLTGKWS